MQKIKCKNSLYIQLKHVHCKKYDTLIKDKFSNTELHKTIILFSTLLPYSFSINILIDEFKSFKYTDMNFVIINKTFCKWSYFLQCFCIIIFIKITLFYLYVFHAYMQIIILTFTARRKKKFLRPILFYIKTIRILESCFIIYQKNIYQITKSKFRYLCITKNVDPFKKSFLIHNL